MSCDNVQKQIILRVMNPTSHDIELPVNKIVASVSDIHHDNVYVLDNANISKSSAYVIHKIFLSTDAHLHEKTLTLRYQAIIFQGLK